MHTHIIISTRAAPDPRCVHPCALQVAIEMDKVLCRTIYKASSSKTTKQKVNITLTLFCAGSTINIRIRKTVHVRNSNSVSPKKRIATIETHRKIQNIILDANQFLYFRKNKTSLHPHQLVKSKAIDLTINSNSFNLI
jgi:hypothetical protein